MRPTRPGATRRSAPATTRCTRPTSAAGSTGRTSSAARAAPAPGSRRRAALPSRWRRATSRICSAGSGISSGSSLVGTWGRRPPGAGGGEVYLPVQVQPHPIFERRGDDVHVDVPVSLTEALLGAEIEVPTLEGKVTMTIPPESQNGRTFRLRRLGVQKPDGTRGDQLARIRVILPTTLTSDERRFFEEMRRRRPQK